MRQAKIVIHVVHSQLLPQALLSLAQRAHPPPNGRHMLAQAEIDPLHKGRIDLPAQRAQYLIDGLDRAEHDAMLHVDQTPPAYRFHYLGVEQCGQGHPARLRGWPCRLTARYLDPVAKMGHDGGEVLLIAITEKQWHAV